MTNHKNPEQVRPIVVISKCLEFEACRYNGQMIGFDFVKTLREHVDFVPICPEVEIGLGTPRDPIKIVGDRETLRLVQPSTGRDLTASMREFSAEFLNAQRQVDGFILKSKSPSCGIKGVRVHLHETFEPQGLTARGFFAGAVIERFKHAAITDELSLSEARARDHWLTKLFLFARLRHAQEQSGILYLEQFHEENRMLLLSFDLVRTWHLDRIVHQEPKLSDSERWIRFRNNLTELVRHMPKRSARTNSYIWAMGKLRDHLNPRDRNTLHQLMNNYANGRAPRAAVDSQLIGWATEYPSELVRRQTFFCPYPRELANSAVE